MFGIKTYHQASSVQEAVYMLSNNPESRPLAGGTDILVRLREGHSGYGHLVDIHHLKELQNIALLEDGTLSLGSGISCSDLINSELVQTHTPVLAQAADMLGGPQVRNAATLGGNICNGAPSAENASPLLALDAVVKIAGPDGERTVPIEQFYKGPGKVDLHLGELVTSFDIPEAGYKNTGGEFCKYAMRNAMDIATIGCSAVCRMDGDIIEDLRIAFTVAAPVPTRCRTAENVCEGHRPSKAMLRDFSALVHKDLNPRESWRASKDFRQHIISTLAKRVTKKAIIKAGGTLGD